MLTPRDYQQQAYEAGIQHARTSKKPCVLELGTAAGKSVIVAMLAHTVMKAGKRVLVLMPSSDLVIQNASKYRAFGEQCSIYSAKLGKKHTGHKVVFATPISVANNLDDFGQEYALIIFDECDGVGEDPESSYQKIIAHAREVNPNVRLVGLTATPLRGKQKLVGPKQTFKSIAYTKSGYELSQDGWTVPFVLGVSGEHYDLIGLKTDSFGRIKQSEVDKETLGKEKTKAIVQDAMKIMSEQGRKCGLFFCSSLKHAKEVLSYLPVGEAAMIDGGTATTARAGILDETRAGKWRYLVNVGTLCVGTDLPIVDTIVLLRYTDSLRLLLQILGRGCRLYCPSWSLPAGEMNRLHMAYDGKRDCLVLDHGENLERFGLDDDLTITALVAAKDRQEDDEDDFFAIECPTCGTENRHTSQRCVGIDKEGIRCSYRFIFKTCEPCGAQNSPSARDCWKCDATLIDPAERLTRKAAVAPGTAIQVAVINMTLRSHWKGESQSLRVDYSVTDGVSTWGISEFLKGYGLHKFGQQTGAIGQTVDTIVAAAKVLKMPTRLMVKKRKGSKYYDVAARYHDSVIDSENLSVAD